MIFEYLPLISFIVLYHLLLPFLPLASNFFWVYLVPILASSGYIYPLDILLAIPLIYVFYVSFHVILRATNFLGTYRKYNSRRGRGFGLLKILGCYMVLTTPTYFTILSIVELPPPPSLLGYIFTFPIMIAFLISLRILANPTKPMYRVLYGKNPDTLSDSDKLQLRDIREQVISFYFGLTEAAIVIFCVGIFFGASKQKLISNITGLLTSPESCVVLVVSYFLALFILGLVSEIFLERTEVIVPDA